MAGDRIRIGGLKGPHGLQGFVKAKLFLADTAVLAGQAVQLEDGTNYAVLAMKPVGQGLLALQLQGISTPEAAAALKGALYLPKAAIPPSDDEVLLADLIGQPLRGPNNEDCGTIAGLAELPAGPALQIRLLADPAKQILVPLNGAFIEITASTPPTAQLTELGAQLLTL